MAVKSMRHGVEKFYETRYAARVYAAHLAKELGIKGGVLDLTIGWGTTASVYKQVGYVVYGVDRNPESKVADEIAPSQTWLKQRADCRGFGIVDFEPYGLATDILVALFENLHKFSMPLMLCVGCNLRNVITRHGKRLDWWHHLRTNLETIHKAMDAHALEHVWDASLGLRAAERGYHFEHHCTLKRRDYRKVMTIGMLYHPERRVKPVTFKQLLEARHAAENG